MMVLVAGSFPSSGLMAVASTRGLSSVFLTAASASLLPSIPNDPDTKEKCLIGLLMNQDLAHGIAPLSAVITDPLCSDCPRQLKNSVEFVQIIN